MKNKFTYLKALFVDAGRAEYFSADLTPYIIGAVLGLASANADFTDWYNISIFLHGLFVVICAHYSAVWSNVLSDYELDKKYKSTLPQAVDIITKKYLTIFIVLFSLIGTFLVLDLSLKQGQLTLFYLWAIGLFSSHIYTLEPIRLKKYPLIGDIARGLPIVIPMIFGFFLFSENVNNLLVYNFVGISINLLGLFLIGEVWDWKDDKGYVKTIAVVLGYKFCLNWGIVLILVGIIICILGYYPFIRNNTPILIYMLLSVVVMIVFFGIFYYTIYRKRNNYLQIEHACGLLTKIGTTSIWLWFLIGASVFYYNT